VPNLTHGNSYVTFQSFPFFLGETMTLTLTKIPKKLTVLQMTLRCIEEAYEIHGTGENKKSVVVCYQIYKEVKILDNVTSQPTDDVSVLWHLPDDKALTSTPVDW